MKNFQGKVAFITGAGSGIGRALAQALFQAGARLALSDLDSAGLNATRVLLGGDVKCISLHLADVSDLEQVRAATEAAISHHGQVDLLINNAGISLTPTPFENISEAQFQQVLAVNLWGVYNGTRALLPHLRTRPEAAIVNLSSLAGLVGLYGYAPYAMSKFAVRGLSEALQMELAGTKVSVLVVHPGGVKTNLIKNAPNLETHQREAAHQNFSKMALLTPEAVARRILRAVQKKQGHLILGADAKLVMAIRWLFPRRFPQILGAVFGQATFQ